MSEVVNQNNSSSYKSPTLMSGSCVLKAKPEISVAPMMDLTDHHCRYFLRLISPNTVLYTEMVTAQALKYGNVNKLLHYDASEQPLVLQVAGCDPKDLAHSAKLAEQHGFKEVNLNVGCPSDRVQKAKIGACLMGEPELVADCIKAMTDVVDIPVTIKTRIGIDEYDSYEFLCDFINKIHSAGCNKYIIHARKAWLNGLNPKQNRTIPELNYSRVHQIKQDYKNLDIILNGGIETVEDVKNNLGNLDGMMIGRAVYNNPFLLADIERELFNNSQIPSRFEVAEQLVEYIYRNLKSGVTWTSMVRHYMGLFKGQPGARSWRQFLSETRDIDASNVHAKLDQIINYLTMHEQKSSQGNLVNY